MSKARDIADSAATINALDGVTATGTELNILDGVTATTAELNILDGVTATTAELNYVDGVTSNIQTQFNNLSGGGEQTFTATGAITAGDLVAIRSDGTVESVAESAGPGEAGEPTRVTGAGGINGECAMCFDPNQGAYIFMYRSQDNSGYLYGVVGVSDGSSISWGTPAAIASTSVNYVDAVYNSNTQNVCIHLNNGSSQSSVVAVTLNASTKSFSAGSLYNVVSVNSAWNRITYDPDTQKTIQIWTNMSSAEIGYSFGSWSGTAYSNSGFGTAVSSTGSPNFMRVPDITYDQSQDKVLVVYSNGDDGKDGYAIVGTVGASSITWGTAVEFDANDVSDGNLHLEYYPDASKSIVAYRVSSAGYANTITISGTTPSFGTATSTGNRQAQQLAYDSDEGKIIEVYKKTDAPDQNFAKIDVYSVTGTTVVVDSTISLTDEAYVGSTTNDLQGLIYDTDGIYVFGYYDSTSPATVAGIGYDVSVITTNAADWIGIAKENISSAASGTIYITSGISADQTGLTQGTGYYVTSTGGLSSTATGYPFVGYATDTTDILIGGKNLPSETGQSGKFLTTNGTNLSWAGIAPHAEYVNTYTVTSGSSITINNFSETYDHWIIIFSDVKNTSNDATRLELQMEVAGSVVTGSNSYHGQVSIGTGTSQTSTESIYLQYGTPLQATGTYRASGIIYVLNTQGSLQETQVHGQGGYGNDTANGYHVSFYGHRRSTAGALTGVKLSFISGTNKTLSGTFHVYGIKTS